MNLPQIEGLGNVTLTAAQEARIVAMQMAARARGEGLVEPDIIGGADDKRRAPLRHPTKADNARVRAHAELTAAIAERAARTGTYVDADARGRYPALDSRIERLRAKCKRTDDRADAVRRERLRPFMARPADERTVEARPLRPGSPSTGPTRRRARTPKSPSTTRATVKQRDGSSGHGGDGPPPGESPSSSRLAPNRQSDSVAPLCVTDLTCQKVIGVPWRTLRAWLDRERVPYAKIGRRPTVRIDRLFEALDRASGAASRPVWTEQTVFELDAARQAAKAARGAR